MIDLIDVSKSYGPGLPAVNHANLHVDKGEFVFIVGNSGSGKSTLIKLLLKELDSTSGTIIVSGEKLEGMKHRRVAKYRRKLGVVFQDFRLLKDRNVYENIAFAQQVVGAPNRLIKKNVMAMLKLVGLPDKAKSYPNELSGGEQQRVILARALAQQTPCLILDEPTNHLDITHQLQLLKIVKKLDATVISAIHDLNIAAMFCDRIYVLKNGEIVAQGTPREILTRELIREIYEVESDIVEDSKGNMHILFY